MADHSNYPVPPSNDAQFEAALRRLNPAVPSPALRACTLAAAHAAWQAPRPPARFQVLTSLRLAAAALLLATLLAALATAYDAALFRRQLAASVRPPAGDIADPARTAAVQFYAEFGLPPPWPVATFTPAERLALPHSLRDLDPLEGPRT